MTELMRQILARKHARRRELAALPVGEKLRILEEMVAKTRAIFASHPPKPFSSMLAIKGGPPLPASAL